MKQRMPLQSAVLAAIGVMTFHVGPAVGSTGSDKTNHPPVELDFSFEQVFRADPDQARPAFSYREYTADLEWYVVLLGIDHRAYRWRGGVEAEPWGSLTRLSPGLQYYRTFNDAWGVWALFYAMAGFEDDITSRSWTYNPKLIGLHRRTEPLIFYLGAGALYHPVDPVYYPILGLAWNPDAETGWSGSIGFPDTIIRYRFSERWALKTDFHWKIRTYRLADDNAIAPRGYVRTEDLAPGAHLAFYPREHLTLTAGVRRRLGRSLTLYDRDERELQSTDVDSVWSAVLSLGCSF